MNPRNFFAELKRRNVYSGQIGVSPTFLYFEGIS